MNHDSVLQKSPRFASTRLHYAVPVLIEVPTISLCSRNTWRPVAGVATRPRRRRLRREVRLAGYMVLTAMTLTTLIPWGIRPARSSLSHLSPARTGPSWTDHRATFAPPLVSLSIEPVSLVPAAEAKLPVILPGYLLPDDGPDEEPAHAGY